MKTSVPDQTTREEPLSMMVQTGYMTYHGGSSPESPSGFFIEDHYDSPQVPCAPDAGVEARFFFRVEFGPNWDRAADPEQVCRQLTLDQARYLAKQILHSVSQAEESLQELESKRAAS